MRVREMKHSQWNWCEKRKKSRASLQVDSHTHSWYDCESWVESIIENANAIDTIIARLLLSVKNKMHDLSYSVSQLSLSLSSSSLYVVSVSMSVRVRWEWTSSDALSWVS